MKIVKKSIPVLLLMFAVLLIGSGCPSSSSNPGPADCDFEGVTLTESNGNVTMIPETDLNTQFFPNAANGPNGAPGIEIVENIDFTMFFITNVITDGAEGSGNLNFNNVDYAVWVSCELEGDSVGEEMRYIFTSSDVNGEFCVVIDEIVN